MTAHESRLAGVARQTAAAQAAGKGQQEPLVSICVSAYNVERFVGQALGSILAQTYRNLEVIVIDNGSADRTFEVAQAIGSEAGDGRVSCFRVPENLGGYQAMNRVAAMANGDFIGIYHSDDYYEPAIVAKEVAYLQSHPEVGAVFTLTHFMDEEGRIFGGLDLPAEFAGKESLGYDEVFRYIIRHRNTLFCCPSFMIRREVLQSVGPFDPERWDIGSDLEMWLRIVRRFPVAILNERLMRYRVGRGQWTSRYHHLRTTEDRSFAVMDHYIEKDGWSKKLSAADRAEDAFHRCDDNTFRAAQSLILGDVAGSRALLRARRYPVRTLRNGITRRKLRLLVLRQLLAGGLRLRMTPLMVPVLRRMGR